MNNHVKPTTEELEAGIKAAQEALDKPEVVIPSEEEVVVTPDQEPEVIEEEKVTEPAPSTEEAEEVIDPDYKEKFTQSTRESQILAAKNRKLTESIEEANGINPPTDEELAVEATRQGFSFEYMSDIEKALFRTNILNDRKLSKISEVTKETKDIEAWNGKVDTFIDDPATLVANPKLEGKQDAFKLFAGKPSRRGVDFPDLVSAFLYDATLHAKPKQKGQMFEQGTGGAKEIAKPKSDKITLEEAGRLRDTDYNKYKEYLIAGKIADE